MIVKKDSTIYHFGVKLSESVLQIHLDYLERQNVNLCDEIKNFRLVKTNVNQHQRNELLAFIKRLEDTFNDMLALTVSWRVDFTELTSYTVQGDA